MKRTIIAAALGVALVFAGATSASAVGEVGTVIPFTPESNSASWWNDYGEHPATCYKHEGSSAHGSITDGGKTVTLAAFDPSWGDHWETLAIKAGTSVNVIAHPQAGVAYASPNNPGGKQADVSHWIVCKGAAPEPEPTAVTPSANFVDHACSATGSMTLSDTEGVLWELVAENDTMVPAGTPVNPPAGTWPALLNGGEAESAENPRYVGGVALTALDADPNDDIVIADDAKVTWKFTFSNVATPCPVDVPEEPEGPSLAETGVDDAAGWLAFVAMLLVGLGGTALFLRHKRV